MIDPDDKDSLIGGDALSNDNSSAPPDESLIDDSPLNNEGKNETEDTGQSIPPPAD